MRHAPSVHYPVGRSFVYAGFLLTLAVVSLVLWWTAGLRSGVSGLSILGGLCLWVIWVCFAVWSWVHTPNGVLRWDALAETAANAGAGHRGAWVWRSAAYQGGVVLLQVGIAWDGQSLLLLRLSNAAGVVWWVWAIRSADHDQWDGFRRALVATAGRH